MDRAGAGAQRGMWRSMEEQGAWGEGISAEPEFGSGAAELPVGLSRRQFLGVMGASAALAGMSGCTRQPAETIIPYATASEPFDPEQPVYFATSHCLSGYARGILVKSQMGRPVQIEGNPDHSASLGATDIFAQAAILELWDPDRSRHVLHRNRLSSWAECVRECQRLLASERANGGEGLRILTETVTSPSWYAQLEEVLGLYPGARWHQYDPIHRDTSRSGARLVFDAMVDTHYRFDRAERIACLDGDFLTEPRGGLAYARAWAERRRLDRSPPRPTRLFAIESSPTLAGAAADHRQSARAGQIESVAIALGRVLLGLERGSVSLTEAQWRWVQMAAADLRQFRGASLVYAGEFQSPRVHALSHLLNDWLGNVGQTVFYTDPVEPDPAAHLGSIRQLSEDLQAGRVSLLIILGANPVYTAPSDLDFAEAMQHAPNSVHWGIYPDETSARATWHIPAAHFLETWGDARAFDGTISTLQPLIAPLYHGKSAHEVLALLLGTPQTTGYEVVRGFWRRQYAGNDFDVWWRDTLQAGLMKGTDLAARPVRPAITLRDGVLNLPGPAGHPPATSALELLIRPDPTIRDGAFNNNAWLQELPKPLSQLTWDNTAQLSPRTARRLGLSNGDVIDLSDEADSIEAPVWILPGHADDAVTIHLGYGRTETGRVGVKTGFNAYRLRTTDAPWSKPGVRCRKTGRRSRLATAQEHHRMAGRDLVRVHNFTDWQKLAGPARPESSLPQPSLYPPFPSHQYAWGMVIDLNACIGCKACVIACQAENNIPVVGKREVLRGREMHWIRVDRYYAGEPDEPAIYHQPVPCMHCELAPCEVVCPVGATTHSVEGLNEMTYNRCIGTRFCSNNCPYKVRRFNFFDYGDRHEPQTLLRANPEVTIRSRGVMEKCTYCVQRINQARIVAKMENRLIRDGEVQTACQVACPTQAIVFGNLLDSTSAAAMLRSFPHHYSLLAELNTRPRTTYLARVQNPRQNLEPMET